MICFLFEALSLYLTENGIEQEKDYAYGTYPDEQSAKSGICKYNRSLAYATVKKVYKTIENDELSLKQALVNSGVVAIGVDASECRRIYILVILFKLKIFIKKF